MILKMREEKPQNELSVITVPEYGKSSLVANLSEKEKQYLESKKYFNSSEAANIEVDRAGHIKNNGPWVGVIKVNPEQSLHFCTKMNANFFFMLSCLNRIDSFHYDPTRIITLEEGGLFLDIIAKVFVDTLVELRKKGVIKNYVHQEENLRFLRGKLKIKEQLRKNIFSRNAFYCKYEDLTIDNFENRTILYALSLLSKRVSNAKVKFSILRQISFLSSYISLTKINPEDILNINYNRKNQYYEKILKISYHVIRNIFARDVLQNKGLGCNFIVDMNHVYEGFITEMFREIFMEESVNLVLKSQKEIKNLVVEGKRFTLRPDIILQRGENIIAILDVKYKIREGVLNSDFYQMVTYALAFPNANLRLLLYEEINNDNYSYSKVSSPLCQDIRIDFAELRVSDILNETYPSISDFKSSVKRYIRESPWFREILSSGT
jgi:5-methylcytosine-specific restriction enzyme subunit McrC